MQANRDTVPQKSEKSDVITCVYTFMYVYIHTYLLYTYVYTWVRHHGSGVFASGSIFMNFPSRGQGNP